MTTMNSTIAGPGPSSRTPSAAATGAPSDTPAANALSDHLATRWAAGHVRTIGCGPGWYDLILRLDTDLARICPDYRISRIRVRDGLLRYEIHLGGLPTRDPDRGAAMLAVRQLLERYETASGHICEQTGGPGRRMRRGHEIRTLSAAFRAEGWDDASDTQATPPR
jgi:hypothetical protein